MIKPERLRRGDKVAIVSLSRGMLGESNFIHKYHLAKRRLEDDYGLEVVAMENALKGTEFLYEHPEKRAEDFMNAVQDRSIKGIINAIGGDDSIRLLPYMDFDAIRENPKIFTGFSDTTVSHFIMHKAGVISYYGASLMNNFAEYVRINDYTKEMIEKTLFFPEETLDIPSAPYFYDDEDGRILWKEENQDILKPYHEEKIGYEVIQGEGIARGRLLGGCLDVFQMVTGTKIWPTLDEWRDRILFIETSEEDMTPDNMTWLLRNLAAQGIFKVISGVLFAKPARRSRYESYKEVLRKVIGKEAGRPDLPVLGNVNFGHAEPIGVIPLGIEAEIDTCNRTLRLLEKASE